MMTLKFRAFDIALTLAAFAALFFLLPADKEITSSTEKNAEVSVPHPSVTTKANQQSFKDVTVRLA
ncbi:MAG: hypothetical protein ACU836_02550 [Gammaproteobacteria bacterium]